MAQEMANAQGYPGLSRHPELQRIREAQNNLYIDPNFMSRLMGYAQNPNAMNTAQQAGGQMMQGMPQMRKDQNFMQWQGDVRNYRDQQRQQRMGNPQGQMGGMGGGGGGGGGK